MDVPVSVRDMLYRRADGRCECEISTCRHQGRCGALLVPGTWVPLPLGANEPATLSNHVAVCLPCHLRFAITRLRSE
jgi:hypothetical protein